MKILASFAIGVVTVVLVMLGVAIYTQPPLVEAYYSATGAPIDFDNLALDGSMYLGDVDIALGVLGQRTGGGITTDGKPTGVYRWTLGTNIIEGSFSEGLLKSWVLLDSNVLESAARLESIRRRAMQRASYDRAIKQREARNAQDAAKYQHDAELYQQNLDSRTRTRAYTGAVQRGNAYRHYVGIGQNRMFTEQFNRMQRQRLGY